jgi:uncharacterized protein (TIGR03435 family)
MKLFTFAPVVLAVVALANAQTPAAFEVASIKPTQPAGRGVPSSYGVKIDNAIAVYRGYSLRDLILAAFRVKPFQLAASDWTKTVTFDIQGKLPAGSKKEQVPEMLQALLAQRFKMTFHLDTKEFPVYALIVGKDGSKPIPRADNYQPGSGNTVRPMTMESLAVLLTAWTDEPVLDLTELQGDYMVPKDLVKVIIDLGMAKKTARPDGLSGGGSDSADGDLFAEVRKLGLKMEARKVALPVIVLDHIEKTPTEEQ